MHGLWAAVFGNHLPVEIEVGSGTGTFLLAAAARQSRTNFFGIEHSRGRVQRLQGAIDRDGLPNVRALAADAACVVTTLVPDNSVVAYHVYFPDPWWKRRHHRRRLFTATFVAALARTLVPGGRVYIATDVDATFALMGNMLRTCMAFAPDDGTRSPRAVVTAFERKGIARGAVIKEAVFVKRPAVVDLYSALANRALDADRGSPRP